MKRYARYILPTATVISALAVAVGLYFFFDPAGSALFPKCPFRLLTGLQCPGCGSQRALHALLHGDIARAWRFNAMLVTFIPVLAVMIPVQLLRRSYPRLYQRVFGTPVIWGTFIAVMAWWIARNIWGW